MTSASTWISLVYLVTSAGVLLLWGRFSPRGRNLAIPFWVNFLVAAAIFLTICLFPRALRSISPLGESRQEIFVAFLLLTAFALFVEIPGFLLNVHHDDKIVRALGDFEQAVLAARIDPSTGIEKLAALCESYRPTLEKAGMESFVCNAVNLFKRIRNIDPALASVLLDQLANTRLSIKDRSKHPFPLLIQVFGLSCVAFLLAEILATLRTSSVVGR